MHTPEALETHRKPGDVQERQAANAAMVGKQYGEQTFSGPPEPNLRMSLWIPLGNNRRPFYCNYGLASPDSILATAEDEPPHTTTARTGNRGQSA
jgi:hypothetical protein